MCPAAVYLGVSNLRNFLFESRPFATTTTLHIDHSDRNTGKGVSGGVTKTRLDRQSPIGLHKQGRSTKASGSSARLKARKRARFQGEVFHGRPNG